MEGLLEDAKKYVRMALAGLEFPDDDIRPVLLFTGPHGMGIMPMAWESDDDKDAYAEAITASLVVARATETTFISAVWMALSIGKKPTVMPRHNPDHTEAVMLMHCRADKPPVLYSAKVARRVNQPPELGEWEQDGPMPPDPGGAPMQFGGRFANAISHAFHIINHMPQEMIDIIDEGWERGEQAELVEQFIKAAARVKAELEKHPPDVDIDIQSPDPPKS